MTRFIIALLCGLIAWSAPTHAQLYVKNTAPLDNSDCSLIDPCKTLQHAVSIAPSGVITNINLICSTYPCTFDQNVSVSHQKEIAFWGDCADSITNVTVNAPAGAAAFFAEDLAGLWVSCIKITNAGQNGVGIGTRQFAFADYWFVTFGPNGHHLSANEISKINCLGNSYIAGGASTHATAGFGSEISLNCPIYANSEAFGYFLAVSQGRISISSGSVSHSGITGGSYSVDQGRLVKGSTVVPGSGTSVVNGGVVQ